MHNEHNLPNNYCDYSDGDDGDRAMYGEGDGALDLDCDGAGAADDGTPPSGWRGLLRRPMELQTSAGFPPTAGVAWRPTCFAGLCY